MKFAVAAQRGTTAFDRRTGKRRTGKRRTVVAWMFEDPDGWDADNTASPVFASEPPPNPTQSRDTRIGGPHGP